MSVRCGDQTRVERLLGSGININCLYYGWTPLQLAIDIGNEEMATFLIESGCDFEFHDKNNKSPFEDAVIKKQAQVVETLLKMKVNGDIIMANGETPVTYAVLKHHLQLLEVLIRGGVSINKCNQNDHSALFIASSDGDPDLVKVLVSAGADVNFSNQRAGGYTPLIAATAGEHKAVVSLLTTQSGCNLNAQDVDGWTSLWHAYSNGSDDICAVLLKAGADKKVLNADGVSVVEDAKSNNDEVMIELFQKFNNLV